MDQPAKSLNRRRWARGVLLSLGVTLGCWAFSDIYVTLALDGLTNRIRWPFDEAWWKVLVCIPVFGTALWAFGRPKPCGNAP
jgi:hypothetical protein